jgi:hypothetical protein
VGGLIKKLFFVGQNIRRGYLSGESMKLKKVEPRVTFSVAHLHRVWLIPAFLLNFPKKVLLFSFPLSISAKHVHWASYSDLLGFSYNLCTRRGVSRFVSGPNGPPGLEIGN